MDEQEAADEEAEKKLIRIPRAPLSIDWGLFERYSYLLEDIDGGIEDFGMYQQEHPEVANISSCVEELHDKKTETASAFLSPLGQILWEKFCSDYLRGDV